MINPEAIKYLLERQTPHESIETEVVNALVHMGEDFLDSILGMACKATKQRGDERMVPDDVLIAARLLGYEVEPTKTIDQYPENKPEDEQEQLEKQKKLRQEMKRQK